MLDWNKKIRLILFDLDGTLLYPDHEIPEESVAVLSQLMSLGVRVGFATGRTRLSIEKYQKKLNPNGPHILFNGAGVYDLDSNSYLFQSHLPFEEALRALYLAKKYDLHINLYVDDDVYIEKESPRSIEYSKKDNLTQKTVGPLDDFLNTSKNQVTKIMFIGEPSDLDEIQPLFESQMQKPCHLVRSEETYLEFLNFGVSKGEALPAILDKFGIKENEIMAFGDNQNDIELVKKVGLGIAMENAHPKLKEVADHIIGPNDKPSISKFLIENRKLFEN